MDELYKERGGAMVGKMFGYYVSATWPFAVIQIFPEKIILKVLWKIVELPFSDIVEVKRSLWFPFIADGVRIYHKRDDISSLIIFWSIRGNAKKICTLIESNLIKV